MKLVVGSTDLQFNSFFQLGAVGFSIEELKNWRIEKLKNWRIEELKNWLMKLVVGIAGLQLHSFFKLVSVGFWILDFGFWIFDWRIEELERTDEAGGWEHRPTVAFFF
jgi:hypothetical protein